MSHRAPGLVLVTEGRPHTLASPIGRLLLTNEDPVTFHITISIKCHFRIEVMVTWKLVELNHRPNKSVN